MLGRMFEDMTIQSVREALKRYPQFSDRLTNQGLPYIDSMSFEIEVLKRINDVGMTTSEIIADLKRVHAVEAS